MAQFSEEYPEYRDQIRTGDIFAFGGKGNFSNIIKSVTRSNVSHVGVALVSGIADKEKRVQIVESTSLDGFAGVSVGQASGRLDRYEGEVWWLPLGGLARKQVTDQSSRFVSFLFGQVGKPYDMSQAVKAGIDALDDLGIGHSNEDFSKFFCSELVAAALQEVHAFGKGIKINCSEVTPIDLCMFKLYGDNVPILLKGDDRVSIRAFNSITVPHKWGDPE